MGAKLCTSQQLHPFPPLEVVHHLQHDRGGGHQDDVEDDHQERPLPPLCEGEQLPCWVECDRSDVRPLVHHRHLKVCIYRPVPEHLDQFECDLPHQILLAAVAGVVDFDRGNAASSRVEQRLVLAEVETYLSERV